MAAIKFKITEHYNKCLLKIFKVHDIRSGLKPLIYCLNIMGMNDLDLKQYPLNCIKCFVIVILFSYGCAKIACGLPYYAMHKGYAVEILYIIFIVSSGYVSVIVFYISRFNQSVHFEKIFQNLDEVDKDFKKMQICFDYLQLARTTFIQVVFSVLCIFLTFIMFVTADSWKFNVVVVITFMFPFLNQSFYYCEYIDFFYLILERYKHINTQLRKIRINYETESLPFINDLILMQNKLYDSSELLVHLNGPTDVATRLISLIVTVFTTYSFLYSVASGSSAGADTINAIFGMFCNQIYAFMFLRTTQRCMLEVNKLYRCASLYLKIIFYINLTQYICEIVL